MARKALRLLRQQLADAHPTAGEVGAALLQLANVERPYTNTRGGMKPTPYHRGGGVPALGRLGSERERDQSEHSSTAEAAVSGWPYDQTARPAQQHRVHPPGAENAPPHWQTWHWIAPTESTMTSLAA